MRIFCLYGGDSRISTSVDRVVFRKQLRNRWSSIHRIHVSDLHLRQMDELIEFVIDDRGVRPIGFAVFWAVFNIVAIGFILTHLETWLGVLFSFCLIAGTTEVLGFRGVSVDLESRSLILHRVFVFDRKRLYRLDQFAGIGFWKLEGPDDVVLVAILKRTVTSTKILEVICESPEDTSHFSEFLEILCKRLNMNYLGHLKMIEMS